MLVSYYINSSITIYNNYLFWLVCLLSLTIAVVVSLSLSLPLELYIYLNTN